MYVNSLFLSCKVLNIDSYVLSKKDCSFDECEDTYDYHKQELISQIHYQHGHRRYRENSRINVANK